MIRTLAFFIVCFATLTSFGADREGMILNCVTSEAGELTGALSFSKEDARTVAKGIFTLTGGGISYEFPVTGELVEGQNSEYLDLSDISQGSNIYNIHVDFDHSAEMAPGFIIYTNMPTIKIACDQ